MFESDSRSKIEVDVHAKRNETCSSQFETGRRAFGGLEAVRVVASCPHEVHGGVRGHYLPVAIIDSPH